eukprot:gene8465-biopygen18126
MLKNWKSFSIHPVRRRAAPRARHVPGAAAEAPLCALRRAGRPLPLHHARRGGEARGGGGGAARRGGGHVRRLRSLWKAIVPLGTESLLFKKLRHQ